MLSSGGILFSDVFWHFLEAAFAVAVVAFFGALLYYTILYRLEGR